MPRPTRVLLLVHLLLMLDCYQRKGQQNRNMTVPWPFSLSCVSWVRVLIYILHQLQWLLSLSVFLSCHSSLHPLYPRDDSDPVAVFTRKYRCNIFGSFNWTLPQTHLRLKCLFWELASELLKFKFNPTFKSTLTLLFKLTCINLL